MPIEVFCDSCQKKLRVPDTAAGKRIKCPKCQGVISVPSGDAGAPAASSIPTPSKVATPTKTPTPTSTPASTPKFTTPVKVAAKAVEKWFVQTEDGEQYGPVTREELDAWHAEGRVTADTQLLLEGGAQWQWATEVYADLAAAQAPTAENGFPSFGEPAASTPAAGGGSGAFNFGEGAATTSGATKTVTKGKKGSKAKKGKKGAPEETGDKSKMVAGLLGLFLGHLGIHNFYLGFSKKAIIQIVVTICTCGVGGIWGIVEGVMIFMGSIDRDAEGLGLKD